METGGVIGAVVSGLSIIAGFVALAWKYVRANERATRFESLFKTAVKTINVLTDTVAKQRKVLYDQNETTEWWRTQALRMANNPDDLVALWNANSLHEDPDGDSGGPN